MSRRANAASRCPACRMHATLCVCALVPRIETRTRLILVIHRDEERKPTNTGLIAASCLPNSEVHRRGDRDDPALLRHGLQNGLHFDESVQPLVLFPHEDAKPIGAYVDSTRPLSLVVPDGTWRQAGKVRARTPTLRDVPCVTLPETSTMSRRLRAETRPHGMATMEAIAHALGALEGPHVRDALLHLLRMVVERTLWLRGELRDEELTDGVPEAARQNDPRGGRPTL